MPYWLTAALTVLSPLQGFVLALFGTIGFFVMVMTKKPRLAALAGGAFVVGGWGLATVFTSAAGLAGQ